MNDKSSTPKKLPAPKPSRQTPSHIHKASQVRAVEGFAADVELLKLVRSKADRAALGKNSLK